MRLIIYVTFWTIFFWRKIMGKFRFEGKNVIQDLEFIKTVSATVKGDFIEIKLNDGTVESVPKTDINIGQLVNYCCVLEKKTTDDLEIIEFEIEESKECEENRKAWRKSKNLDSESTIKFKK